MFAAAPDRHHPQRSEVSQKPMNDAAAARTKILLIDDDELIAESLRSHLLDRGCAVDLARDSASAETLMAENVYGTVMVDPYLTTGLHHDRLALLGTVRAMQPGAEVIVVTAYASAAIVRAASDGIITTLLLKPKPVTELGRAAIKELPTEFHPP